VVSIELPYRKSAAACEPAKRIRQPGR
jgi:hypothetical protein